jgi:hypothetical protein
MVRQRKLAPATEGGSVRNPLINQSDLKTEKASRLDCRLAFFFQVLVLFLRGDEFTSLRRGWIALFASAVCKRNGNSIRQSTSGRAQTSGRCGTLISS